MKYADLESRIILLDLQHAHEAHILVWHNPLFQEGNRLTFVATKGPHRTNAQ